MDTPATRDRIKFVNSLGQELALNLSTNLHRGNGWSGRFMPPFQIVTSETPQGDGSSIDRSNTNRRNLDFDVVINASSAIEFINVLRSIASIFNPNLGDGFLVCETIDSKVRKICARYSGGFELEEDDSNSARFWQKTVLTFFCPKPYWEDENATSLTIESSSTPRGWFNIFPLALSISSIFSTQNVNVEGDSPVFPYIAITGSGENIVITNETTGQYFQLATINLASEETVYIDCENKTVEDSNGVNLFHLLSGTLFQLVKGENSIRVEIADIDEFTKVDISFNELRLTP